MSKLDFEKIIEEAARFMESADFMNFHKLSKQEVSDLLKLEMWTREGPPNEMMFSTFCQTDIRRRFIKKYGFAIPCREAMEFIKSYVRNELLDVMAGTGYWAYLLNDFGITTRAFDIKPKKNNWHEGDHYPVEEMDAREAIKQNPECDILLSWPPYEDPIGFLTLKAVQPGIRVFYIGEWGGATGDDKMHDYLDKQFKELGMFSLPQFDGIRDYLSAHEKIS